MFFNNIRYCNYFKNFQEQLPSSDSSPAASETCQPPSKVAKSSDHTYTKNCEVITRSESQHFEHAYASFSQSKKFVDISNKENIPQPQENEDAIMCNEEEATATMSNEKETTATMCDEEEATATMCDEEEATATMSNEEQLEVSDPINNESNLYKERY